MVETGPYVGKQYMRDESLPGWCISRTVFDVIDASHQRHIGEAPPRLLKLTSGSMFSLPPSVLVTCSFLVSSYPPRWTAIASPHFCTRPMSQTYGGGELGG